MAEKHPDYWKVKASVHERGEAMAKAQLAAVLAQSAEAIFRKADADLATVMTAAGLDPKADYTLEDRDESITPKP